MTTTRISESDLPLQPSEHRPPRPTYAPAAAALGIMLAIWGFLTMWIMSVAGLGLFAWAMVAWIREIRLEWKSR